MQYEVARLHTLAGVVSVNHYQAFQDILPEDKLLIVVKALHSHWVLCKGETGIQEVAPFYNNNNYLPLQSENAGFGRSYYCIYCEVGYEKKKDAHMCRKDANVGALSDSS